MRNLQPLDCLTPCLGNMRYSLNPCVLELNGPPFDVSLITLLDLMLTTASLRTVPMARCSISGFFGSRMLGTGVA